jgi:prepilin-type N-terminal cleavage/methylation domain-containing protein
MRKNTGFSLLELMVVIGIIAILSTIAVPGIIGWLPKHRVGSAARDVKSTLEFARSNAIKTNRDVRVEFDFDSETATLTVIEVVDPIVPVENTLRTRQLPGDVRLQDKGLGTPVTFNGHGFCSESGQVDVENRTNTALRRSINLTIGGNSRIQ